LSKMLKHLLAIAYLVAFISPLIILKNSSYEISPEPSLSKTLKTEVHCLSLIPILKSRIAFLNSWTSRDLELLSSAILNFLEIEEIPLVPLLASFSLRFVRSYSSDALAATFSSLGFVVIALALLPKRLLVSWPYLEAPDYMDHPLVP
jgi:hypothetical protein